MTASPSLAVRRVARDDYARWSSLWAGYNAFYERAVPQKVTDQSWERFFDSYEPMHALVAEAGQQVLGFVHYLFHRNTAMIAPTCYLQDIFTSPDSRGKGIGRALIEEVYERARDAGCSRV